MPIDLPNSAPCLRVLVAGLGWPPNARILRVGLPRWSIAGCAEAPVLPDLYIPRGYLSTRQAVHRLFAARHPDLVSSALEREDEERRLHVLKIASEPSLTEPLRLKSASEPSLTEPFSYRPEFTPAHEHRLKELAVIKVQVRSNLEAAAHEIRSALADNILPAILLTDSGHDVPIDKKPWRSAKGLDYVWSGRVRMQMPEQYDGTTEGQALIKDSDFGAWITWIIDSHASLSTAESAHVPQQTLEPPSPANSIASPATATRRMNRGGRPVAWDWVAFNREVVRLANTIDGLPTRAELQRQMLDWCERTWGKSPAESTVREHIALIYPEGE